jgi:hypothetical protein
MHKIENILLAPLNVIETIDDLLKIQCSNGNWNYNEYMHGMANGMILIKSIVTGEQPQFLSAPKKWLRKNSRRLT